MIAAFCLTARFFDQSLEVGQAEPDLFDFQMILRRIGIPKKKIVVSAGVKILPKLIMANGKKIIGDRWHRVS